MSQTTLPSFFPSKKRPASEDISGINGKLQKLNHFERRLKTCSEGINNKGSIKKTDIHHDVKQEYQKINEVNDNHDIVEKKLVIKDFKKPTVTAAFSKKLNVTNVIKSSESSRPMTTISARKELNLGEIRKAIAGSSRLAELKASAERISKGIQQLKEASEKRNLKQFKIIDLEVPSSPNKKTFLQDDSQRNVEMATPEKRPFISPRKVIVSPIKSPSKISSYMKQDTLASKTSNSLPLPYHYRLLGEIFRAMETVVALLYNRNEKITFEKLKPSVQEMLKKNFTKKHLAQIKHIVPDYYHFEMQKIKNFDMSCQKDAYELVVSPNFPNDFKIMNPSILLERRRYFYDTLIGLVKKHHADFLLTLEIPMVISDDKLMRWHPEFNIEKLPEVESDKLPAMPNSEKVASAQDVLAKARELFKCNTRMERAMQKLAEAKARGLTEQENAAIGMKNNNQTEQEKPANIAKNNNVTIATQTNQTSAYTFLNPALRNLPAALLEKVKAKQAAKALEAMTRSSDYEQKYIIYNRLPDLAKTMRNIYVTERKNVLALNIVLSKLDSSFKSNVSANTLHGDIKALAEQVPDWLKIYEIRNTTYIKLLKNADMNNIVSKLQALADKYTNE